MKLSEYPVNTTIESDEQGWYTKDSENYWTPMMACCSSCADDYSIKNDEVDEKIMDFKIRSLPFGVVVQLAIQLQDEYGEVDSEGNDITVYDLIQGGIEAHKQYLDRDVEYETEGITNDS